MLESASIKFPVPAEFRRGVLRANERASVDSALAILELCDKVVPLKGAKILDFGCGVKLVQGLIELGNPHAKYVGLDVYKGMIDYLTENCPYESFEFATVAFHNKMYNPNGEKMTPESVLPIAPESFDLITMFSVITHMQPDDSLAILSILRKYAHADTKLIFSCHVDPDMKEDFVDMKAGRPLQKASYRKDYLEGIVRQAGWHIESYGRPRQRVIKDHYICRPA